MESSRNLLADHLQIVLTSVISIASTLVNLVGFFVISTQNSLESRTFKYTQLLYQVVLYLCQLHAGTVLNIVFLFPVPGVYCIGVLRSLSGKAALWSFMLFDVLFSLQGQLLAVVMVLKVRSIARNNSPFKMSLASQSVFIFVFLSLGQCSQLLVLLASYSPPSEIHEYISRTHPSMTFLSRYPFLWMIPSDRRFVAFYSIVVLNVGCVCTVFLMSYLFLMFELDIQVSSMSHSTNKFHRKVVNDILIHGAISLPFFILVPSAIFIKFFLDPNTDYSIPTTVSFSVFVSSPIPSMLVYLFRNPVYREYLLKLLGIARTRSGLSSFQVTAISQLVQ